MNTWIKREFDLYEKYYETKLNRTAMLEVIDKVPKCEETTMFVRDRNYEKLNVTREELDLILLLIRLIPISPLTGEDFEWVLTEDNSVFKSYVNIRSNFTYKKKFKIGITVCYHRYNIENVLDVYRTESKIENREITFPFTVPVYNEYIYDYVFEFNNKKHSILLSNKDSIKRLQNIATTNMICK